MNLLSHFSVYQHRRHDWLATSEIDILHSNVNKPFIQEISHKKNCTMINELIFEKGSENKKLKVECHNERSQALF